MKVVFRVNFYLKMVFLSVICSFSNTIISQVETDKGINSIKTQYVEQISLADSLFAIAKYDESLSLQIEIHAAIPKDHFVEIMKSSERLALLYHYVGGYNFAMDYALKTLQLSERENNLEIQSGSYNLLGMIHVEQKEYTKALEFYAKARELLTEDSSLMLSILNNIGIAHYELEAYGKSLEYDLKLLEKCQALQNDASIGRVLNNIGETLMKLERRIEAGEYYLNSYEIALAAKDEYGKGRALSNLGSLSVTNNPQRAIEYLDKSIQSSLKSGDKQIRLISYGLLSNAYDNQGDMKRSNNFIRAQLALKDSIHTEKSDRHISNLMVVYDMEKKEKALELSEAHVRVLELEQEAAQKRNMILFIVLIGLMVLILMAAFIIRQKVVDNKQKELITHQESTLLELAMKSKDEENNKLRMEVHHRNRELSSLTMNMFNRNEMLSELDNMVNTLKVSSDDALSTKKSIRGLIKRNQNSDANLKSFQVHFEKVHPFFLEKLKAECVKLTDLDLRHCAYIKIGLNTKEIAGLLNISPSSVQMSRVRLKKKLGLNKPERLIEFINNF